MGPEFQSSEMRVLEMDIGDGCTTVGMYLMPPNRTLQNSYNGNFYVMCILPQFKIF